MIWPANVRPGLTLDEAIAGYRDDGFSTEDAETYARVLLGQTIPGLPII